MLLYPGRRRAELYTRQDSRLIVICIGKYNRRKRVDGVWAFGGVDTEDPENVFSLL